MILAVEDRPNYKFQLFDLYHKFMNKLEMSQEEKKEFDERYQKLKKNKITKEKEM